MSRYDVIKYQPIRAHFNNFIHLLMLFLIILTIRHHQTLSREFLTVTWKLKGSLGPRYGVLVVSVDKSRRPWMVSWVTGYPISIFCCLSSDPKQVACLFTFCRGATRHISSHFWRQIKIIRHSFYSNMDACRNTKIELANTESLWCQIDAHEGSAFAWHKGEIFSIFLPHVVLNLFGCWHVKL